MKAYTEYIVNFARTSQLASAIYIFEAYDMHMKLKEDSNFKSTYRPDDFSWKLQSLQVPES